MHVETLRGRVAAIVARAEAARDDAAITEVRAEFAQVDRDVKTWAEDRMTAAREDGRTTLHADDARKAQQLRALIGDAAMAVGDMLAADGEAKANRARLAGGSNRPAARDNGPIESREWKSVFPSMLEYRSQQTSIDPSGGYLVTTEVGQFYDRLRPRSVVLSAGPQIVTMNSDALEMPKLRTSVTPVVGVEGTLITESAVGFGLVRLAARKYSTYTIGSSEWFSDARPDARNIVETDHRLQLAARLDLDMLEGANASGILGLRHTMGATQTSLGAGGATPTLDDILSAIERQQRNNAVPNAIFMHSRTWLSLRKSKDLQDRYLLMPDPSQDIKLSLFGVPVYLSSQIAINEASDDTTHNDCSYIVIADMSRVVVGRRADMAVLYDPFTFSQKDQVAIRTTTRWDLGVLDAAAVEILTGCRP